MCDMKVSHQAQIIRAAKFLRKQINEGNRTILTYMADELERIVAEGDEENFEHAYWHALLIERYRHEK